jgi:2-polyprenyl-6-methoxyphenol hydroxylase-like FAD-dependent oxidoreductase
MTDDQRTAVVVGGSIAGLFTAAFLRRAGWRVDVYERSTTELVGRGAGIFASHFELLEALEALGLSTSGIGVIALGRISLDRSGRVFASKRQLQIVTSWDRIRQLLFSVIDPSRYHLGHTFERVEARTDGVRVRFANGVVRDADLLVGCDGSRSSVRAQFAPDIQPVYAGYFLWRGTPHERDLSPATRNTLFPNYSFYLAEHTQVLGYPIPGTGDEFEPGRRRYNFAWFKVADDDALATMLIDRDGHTHQHSVPPPLVRPELIAAMREEAVDTLPPQYVDCVQQMQQPFFTPISDFAMPTQAFGRVAMVGDAAATIRPHAGFGVSKAASEARRLGELLTDAADTDAALKEYDLERAELSRRIVAHGRRLGTQLGIGIESEEDASFSQLLNHPGAILDWVAVPGFLERYEEWAAR